MVTGGHDGAAAWGRRAALISRRGGRHVASRGMPERECKLGRIAEMDAFVKGATLPLSTASCRGLSSPLAPWRSPPRSHSRIGQCDSMLPVTRTGGIGHGCLGPGGCNRRDEKSERELSISVGVVRRRGDSRDSAVTETEERSMHPMLFECWRRNETARGEQRAEMAAAREARLGESLAPSCRSVRVLGTVRSGLRRAGLVAAGALAYGQRLGGHRLPPATAATFSGKRG